MKRSARTFAGLSTAMKHRRQQQCPHQPALGHVIEGRSGRSTRSTAKPDRCHRKRDQAPRRGEPRQPREVPDDVGERMRHDARVAELHRLAEARRSGRTPGTTPPWSARRAPRSRPASARRRRRPRRGPTTPSDPTRPVARGMTTSQSAAPTSANIANAPLTSTSKQNATDHQQHPRTGSSARDACRR